MVETANKSLQFHVADVDLETEVGKEFPLHLIYLAQAKESLTDNGPALVGVGVVAAALAGEHEGRDEKAVSRRATGCWEARLEALEQEECLVGDREGQPCPVESIGNELGETRCWS